MASVGVLVNLETPVFELFKGSICNRLRVGMAHKAWQNLRQELTAREFSTRIMNRLHVPYHWPYSCLSHGVFIKKVSYKCFDI